MLLNHLVVARYIYRVSSTITFLDWNIEGHLLALHSNFIFVLLSESPVLGKVDRLVLPSSVSKLRASSYVYVMVQEVLNL